MTNALSGSGFRTYTYQKSYITGSYKLSEFMHLPEVRLRPQHPRVEHDGAQHAQRLGGAGAVRGEVRVRALVLPAEVPALPDISPALASRSRRIRRRRVRCRSA